MTTSRSRARNDPASDRDGDGAAASPRSHAAMYPLLNALMEGREIDATDAQELLGMRKLADARARLRELARACPWIVQETRERGRLVFRARTAVARQTGAAPSTWYELFALDVCRGLLHLGADTELRRAIDVQMERALTTAAPGPLPDTSRIFRAVWRSSDRMTQDPDDADRLLRAILIQRLVRFAYATYTGEPDTIVLEPWTMVLSTDGTHVYGRVRESNVARRIGQCRLLACARIHAVEELPGGFALPSGFEYSPDRLWEHCFGLHLPPMAEGPDGEPTLPPPAAVRFEVSPAHAHFLRSRPLHAHLRVVDDCYDGWVVVAGTMHVTLDLVVYLRGLGPDVRRIEPVELAHASHPPR
jgi:hypothetical protein